MPLQKIFRFGVLFSARIAGAASLFAANLLIVRYLGIEALATFAVFVSLVSILAVIISSGFTAVAPVFVAEYSKRGQPELLKGFLNAALNQGGVIAGLLGVLLIITGWLVGKLPFVNNLEMAIGVLLTAVATAFLGFNGGVLVGMKKQVAALLPETFLRPVVFMALSGLFLAGGLITSIDEVLWLLAFSVWLTFGFVLVRDRNLRKNFSDISSRKERPRWRKATLPWMGVTLVWDFMIDLVLLLTSIFAGSVEIAILHICFRYRVLAGFGMRVIHTLLMPEITEHVVDKDYSGVGRKLFQVNIASLVYALSVMGCFALFGSWLLGLFSPEAVAAVPILLTVSATMVIRAIFGPAPLVLATHNFHMITLSVSLVCVVFAMVLIAALVPQIGVMAAAIGYTIANFFISVTLWYFTKKKTGIDCSIFARFFNSKKLPDPAVQL